MADNIYTDTDSVKMKQKLNSEYGRMTIEKKTERICQRCSHEEICKHRAEHLAAENQLRMKLLTLETIPDSVADVVLGCKYFTMR